MKRLAYLRQPFWQSWRSGTKKMDLPKVFGFWNGQMDAADSARLKLAIDAKRRPSEIEIGLPAQSAGSADERSCEGVAKIVSAMVSVYDPMYVSVSPREYFPRQVFDDKPGVGWMLYLPKVLTTQQVPEARELIPVPEAGRKQTGTIIVSVPDAVFQWTTPSTSRLPTVSRFGSSRTFCPRSLTCNHGAGSKGCSNILPAAPLFETARPDCRATSANWFARPRSTRRD